MHPLRIVVTLALLLSSATGCSKFVVPTDLFGRDGQKPPEASPADPVDRVVTIWQPAEGRGVNGVPTRGFAGQVLFIPRSGGTPVIVDGDVRVYVFDDQGTAEEQSKPIHQYDFTNGGWDAQLTSGTLGPAYQVFIPYPRKGTQRADCALRVRFTPKNGGTPVYSEMVKVTLDGTEPDGDATDVATSTEDTANARGPRPADPTEPDTASHTDRASQLAESVAELQRTMNGETAIRPASHETERAAAETGDAAAQRLDRLEDMLQQLLVESRGNPRPSRKQRAATRTPASRPHPLTAQDAQASFSPPPAHPLAESRPVGHPLATPRAAATANDEPSWEAANGASPAPQRRYRLSRSAPIVIEDPVRSRLGGNESFTPSRPADTIDGTRADVPEPDDDVFSQFEVVR